MTAKTEQGNGTKNKIGKIVAVCISPEKGERKRDVGCANLIAGHGVEGDAHAAPWHRQVSLLAMESIGRMRAMGLDVGPGDFAENITTEGLDLVALPVGTRLRAGPVLLEVTQIGKECHGKCAIYYQAGYCVMPREGIFAKVIEGGRLCSGDVLEVLERV